MRALVCALFLFTVFAVSVFGVADWTALIEKLNKSVVQLSDNCSAFVIDSEKDYVLTARHCAASDGTTKPVIVDMIPTTLVAEDIKRDLSVLKVPGMDRPALKFAAKNPRVGEEVASYGFGGGFKDPMFRHGFVSQNKLNIGELEGEWVVVDAAFVGGQSGSPIVNANLEVVGIVQMTDSRMGLGRGVEEILDRIGRFIPKPTPTP